MSIPTDRVDEDEMKSSKRWDMGFIKRFMFFFGILSSIFDYVTFIFLLYIFRVSPEMFRSAWFLEGLLTQVLVLLVLRTKKAFAKSKPSLLLALTVVLVVCVGFSIPLTPLGGILELKPLDNRLYIFAFTVTLTYLLSVEVLKKFFYRMYNF